MNATPQGLGGTIGVAIRRARPRRMKRSTNDDAKNGKARKRSARKGKPTTIVEPPERCLAVPLSIVRKVRQVALADVASRTINGSMGDEILNAARLVHRVGPRETCRRAAGDRAVPEREAGAAHDMIAIPDTNPIPSTQQSRRVFSFPGIFQETRRDSRISRCSM